MFVKARIVVTRREPQNVIVGIVGLQHHFALRARPAASARHLRDELKGAFAAAVIGEMQTHVGVEHAHERDGRKVVPLCHHLRADENIRLAVGKAFQDLKMPFLAARRIHVHAQNARLRI